MKKSKKWQYMGIVVGVLVVVVVAIVYFTRFHNKPRKVDYGDASANTVYDAGEAMVADDSRPNGEEDASVYEEINEYYKMLNALSGLKPGVDYVENEVVSACDNKRQAKKIAADIGGTLKSYSEGIAIINVPMSVRDLMLILAEANEQGVTVSPNYMYTTTN